MAELWFSLDDVPDWESLRAALAKNSLLHLDESFGAVSVVGDAIGADAMGIAGVVAIAEAAKVVVVGVNTSHLRVTLYCARDAVDGLVAILHKKLVEQEPS
jgi:aspartokinase